MLAITEREMKRCLSDFGRDFFFGLVWFDFDISAFLGHLMLSPVYTYILNIQDLVVLGFMAYEPL